MSGKGQTHDLWNRGDDINSACKLSCNRRCLFDPPTAAHSGLKWIGVSMLIFSRSTVLWPAVLVSQLICVLWTWSPMLMLYPSMYRLNKVCFHCWAKPKLELNDPRDREMSVLPGSNNPSDIDLYLLRKPKVPISHMVDLYWFHFCQRGPLSVHQLFYNQFLPDPTWANFPLDALYAGTHLCVCLCIRFSMCLHL